MKLQYLALLLVLILLIGGCSGPENQPSPYITSEMRDVFRTTSQLRVYIWSEQAFMADENHDKIEGLLSHLANDFHNVNQVSERYANDPGFLVTLETSRDLLEDSLKRFKEGNKDYANWRLKGITANCVSCHSRYSVPHDFIMPSEDKDVDFGGNELARAEFLLASRRFDQASDSLFEIIVESLKDKERFDTALAAFKMWFVVEVRVKNRPVEAIGKLDAVIKNVQVPAEHKEVIARWREDLLELSEQGRYSTVSLDYARELLDPVLDNVRYVEDDADIVRTLRASAILHQLLAASLPTEERRRASLLLAMSYLHMPISMFEGYRELYLEQCIREFPRTHEAREAYRAYKDYVEFLNSGSGGLHLDDERVERMEELKKLAFGVRVRV